MQNDSEQGLGELATAVVIGAVFSIMLVGMVVLVQRERAVDAWERAAAVAGVAEAPTDASVRSTPSPTPQPDPPGQYTVRRGDSLFSVAADLGLSPNELIYWNRDEYPTLQSTPALRAGWVLRTAGPPLPTPTPRPTPVPTPDPVLAAPSAPGLPTFSAASFPASDRVTVSWYAVSGATPAEIRASIDANGPWSDWAGDTATANVEVRAAYNVSFRTEPASGACTVVTTADPAVSITYHVVLPAWTPSEGTSVAVVEWWADQLHRTVAHEAHHVTLYEQHLDAMRRVVAEGTCESIPEALDVVWQGAVQANCEFDLAEYGYAAGLSLASCMDGS